MHIGDNNTLVNDKLAIKLALYLHALLLPSLSLILGWPWDMLWSMGH